MMMDWKDYRDQLTARTREIAQAEPDLVAGYQTIAKAKAGSGVLDGKTRELIALAVAVTLRCDGCIAFHTHAAKRNGASKEEIVEALGMAITVNAGATMVYSSRVLDALASEG